MSEHTPGDWRALDTTKSTFGMASVVASLGETVNGTHWCVAAIGEYVADEHLSANARLIAAAPELLRELRLAYQTAKHYAEKEADPGKRISWKQQARSHAAAIARARGGV